MRSTRPRFGRRRGRRRSRAPLWLALLLLAGFLLAGVLRPDLFLQAEFARQRWWAGAEQRFIDVDGRRWGYLEAGDGPPLLLLHGFTGSKENWLPVVDALSRDFRVLAPDLPGWGFGDAPSQPPFGYAADAARLGRFIAAVAGDGPVHLVGHSMGGGIAAVLAGTQPQRVDTLVLMDAAGVAFDNRFAQEVLSGGHPFGVAGREDLDRYMHLVFDDPPWLPWPVDRALIERRIANEPFERQVLAAISGEPGGLAPEQAAPSIRAPTLLLWCRDDRVVDLTAAERYASLIPDTRTVLLDGCNHMPMMEQPAATVEALRQFLPGRR